MPQLGAGMISSIAISPNGRLAITRTLVEHAARIWDLETGKQVQLLKLKNAVVSVGFSEDGSSSLLSDLFGSVHLMDTATAVEKRSFDGRDPQNGPIDPAVVFSPDGHRALVLGARAVLWSVDSGEQLLALSQTSSITSAAFSKDGRFILTGGPNSAVLWNAETGQQVRALSGHAAGINFVALSPDARYAVIVTRGGTVGLWNAESGVQVADFKQDLSPSLQTPIVAFSPDSQVFLTGDVFDLRRWDSVTGRLLGSVTLDKVLGCAAYSPDGRSIFVGSPAEIAILDSSTLRSVRRLEGHTQEIHSVAFSSTAGYLLTGGEDGSARIWDLATGQQTQSLKHSFPVSAVGSLPGDHIFAVSSPAVHIWNLGSGTELRSIRAPIGSIISAVPSPDGRFLLTGSFPGVACLWNADTGQQVRAFEGTPGSVAFTRNGEFALAGSYAGGLRVWNVATGQPNRTFPPGSRFTDDGRYVLTASQLDPSTGNWAQHLWSAETGQQVSILDPDVPSSSALDLERMASSSDGRYLVTTDLYDTASVWEASTGHLIGTLAGHSDTVNSVAISPDNRFVLTGSGDTTTRLWELATGKELAVLLSFENGGWAITDPEGRYDSNDPDFTPGLVWVANGLRPIELAQLKDDYYTPNLLARILKGERLAAVSGLDRIPSPPEVRITSPWNPQTRRAVLSVRDTGGGIGKIVVTVNDRAAAVLGRVVPHEGKLNVDLRTATLRPGENTVTAYACDRTNHIRSRLATATFAVTAAAKGSSPDADASVQGDYFPQFYAIVIGTARYGNTTMNLQYPERDAESMATAMKIGAGHLFGEANVHLRVLSTAAKNEDDQPTKKNILAAFNDVRQKAKSTDVLFVYLSGHGVSLRGERDLYYYLTADARTLAVEDNPALKDLSTVSSTELSEWLGAQNMPLKEVLILDTCAAGAAGEELAKLAEKREVPPDQRRAIEFLKDAAGTVILMGSAADKASYEASKYGQGLLTYALLDGMRGRSVAEGGQLKVGPWFQTASQEVHALAASIGGIQKPVIAAHQDASFSVALLDSADEAKIPLAALKPELLHLSCHDDNDEDPLGLGPVVREQMREISQPSARSPSDPPIVYLDDVHEGPTETLAPKIVYKLTDKEIALRLRLDRDNKTMVEEKLQLSAADLKALANAVAAKFVAMAAKIPAETADH